MATEASSEQVIPKLGRPTGSAIVLRAHGGPSESEDRGDGADLLPTAAVRGAGDQDHARRTQVETDNGRLRRALADLTLDKQILKEAAQGNF